MQFVGAEWRAAVAFVILIAVLLLRPNGLFGRPGMMLDLVGYGAFFLTTALTYAIICLGLNLQWGQTGLFNVGVAGFVADRRLCLGAADDAGRRRRVSAASACRSSSAGSARCVGCRPRSLA